MSFDGMTPATFALNDSLARGIRTECESVMRRMASDMRERARHLNSFIPGLEVSISNDNWIAQTAMQDVQRRDRGGNRFMDIEPNWNARNAASNRVSSMQQQLSLIGSNVSMLNQAAEELDDERVRTGQMFDKMVDSIQNIDHSTAISQRNINDAMHDFIMYLDSIADSIHDRFPIYTNGNLLDKLQSLMGNTALTAMIASQLAGIRVNCALGGDPVNMSTGNFVYSKEDITVVGKYPITFKRFYNAIDATDSVLGFNWTHNYNIHLMEEESHVHIAFDDGHIETFQKLGDRYRAPTGCHNLLLNNSGIWQLILPDMQSYYFDKNGHLFSIKDRNGNEMVLTHTDGLLSKVSTPSGHLSFVYIDNLLTTITDHTGREVVLEYTDKRLTKITHPSGATHEYSYGRSGKLAEIINPLGISVLKNNYDLFARMSKQEMADGGVMHYSYYEEDSKITTLTQQNGAQIHYERDELYRTTAIEYSDGVEKRTYNSVDQVTSTTDKNGNVTHFEYDDMGQMSKVTDALGYKVELEYNDFDLVQVSREDNVLAKLAYDNNGNVIEARDALERISKIEYDNSGQPIKVIAPDESATAIEYDERGNMIAITDALGVVTKYEYNELNHPIATIDGNGNRTIFEYNEAGDITKVTNADKKEQSFEYNTGGKVTRIVDFDGGIIEQEYNSMGKPCRVIDQEGNETKLEYDLMWNVSKQTDANGNSTIFEYNKLNNLESITNAKGAQVQFEYDPNGNRTKVRGPQGEETRLSYDALNRITKVIEPDGAKTTADYDYMGQVTKVTDTMGNESNFVYDKAGQKISETDPSGRELKYTYTALGQIAIVTDSIGRTIKHNYLPGGLLEKVTYPDGRYEVYAYDANKNIVSKASHDGYILNYEYDCLNRITRISSSTGQVKAYAYDAVSNVTSVTDANGNTTKYAYSPNGKLISVIDPLGNKSEYDYDKVGNLTEVKQFAELNEANEINAQNSKLRMTRYDWDEVGQVEKITDALGNQEEYTYDESGNVTKKLDKDGFLTKYAYTASSQLEEVVYADGKSVKLSYNPLRQLTEIRDWLGVTSVEVDELGRAKKITGHNGNEVEYTFGTMGEKQSIKYPDGKVAEYVYDDSLRLKSLIDGSNKVDYFYDNNSRLSDKIFSTGVSTKYTYNEMGLLSELTHSDKDGILDKYIYSYDNMINKTGIDKYRRGLEEESGRYNYSYDALSRLTEVTKDGSQIKSFGYDEFGNRSQMIDGSNKTNYRYNALNQLISTNDTKGVEQHFNYDKRGNLTQILESNKIKNTYEFGAINRLTKATNAMGQTANYDYNGFGFRVGKQVNDNLNPTKHVSYVLDLTKQYHNLLQMSDDTQTHSYTWDSNVAFADGNAYLQDELGSPLRYIDNVGSIVDSYGYTEFGDDLYGNQGIAQPFGYTGYTADSVAGTYFAQAREYLSGTGRFNGVDIIKGTTAAPMTMNQYTYCWNSPMMFTDSNGLFPEWLRDGANAITEGVRTAGNAVTEGIRIGANAIDEGVSVARNAVHEGIRIGGDAIEEGIRAGANWVADTAYNSFSTVGDARLANAHGQVQGGHYIANSVGEFWDDNVVGFEESDSRYLGGGITHTYSVHTGGSLFVRTRNENVTTGEVKYGFKLKLFSASLGPVSSQLSWTGNSLGITTSVHNSTTGLQSEVSHLFGSQGMYRKVGAGTRTDIDYGFIKSITSVTERRFTYEQALRTVAGGIAIAGVCVLAAFITVKTLGVGTPGAKAGATAAIAAIIAWMGIGALDTDQDPCDLMS
ncbi:MAG: DUF6531 domain-containing protein [Oscillospiraceae bacterium]|nr:DUF6531 domain-containing protein [Oscillospiraceae bacterium]